MIPGIQWWLKGLSFLGFIGVPFFRNVRWLYWCLGQENHFRHQSHYLNLGYWGAGAQTTDEAGQAMAQLVGETASLCASDHVLDVGFGYGDQLLDWMDQFGVTRLSGLNCMADQVAIAQDRCVAYRPNTVVDLRVGRAETLPFPDASFDVVLCIEAAFHFDTRDDFLAEAYRVLKPGGRLVMTDIYRRQKTLSPMAHAVQWLIRRFWFFPVQNWVLSKHYEQRLRHVGFSFVAIQSLWDAVFLPYRAQQSKCRQNVGHGVYRWALFIASCLRKSWTIDPLDYGLVFSSRSCA